VPGADHPLNTDRVRSLRPDLVAEWEVQTGRQLRDLFPEETLGAMHMIPFAENITHAENLGGDIEQVLGRRLFIGAFPWRYIDGDASICRVVAFVNDG
jgi:arylformamidase